MSDPVEPDLTALVDWLREGRISATECMADTLARIRQLQPTINAFISVDAEEALAAARQADRHLGSGARIGRLHGLPIAFKDMFHRAGRVSTCGSRILRDVPASSTATAVQRLESEGALYVGGLNMAEFAAGGTGHNVHFGHCRNPWNPAHITGGSSSGSAAAVAARMVPGALGSDTGGSVRLPAALCGVVGLKPTQGRISLFGIMPRSWSTDTIGPLTRSVRDCALLTSVLAGADPLDPECAMAPVPDYPAEIGVGIQGLRIGIPRDYFWDGIDAEIAASLEQGIAVLRSRGAMIRDVEIPGSDTLFALAQLILKAEAMSLHERWIRERPQDYDIAIRSQIEGGAEISAVDYIQALRLRGPLLEDLKRSVFDHCDLVLTPVVQQRTPTLEESNPQDPQSAARVMGTMPRCTRPFSYLGLPALSVPCGFRSDGLPIGMQLVAPPFGESLLFRAGHAFQQGTDWHRAVPPIVRPLSAPE